jgi:hypothetical protein
MREPAYALSWRNRNQPQAKHSTANEQRGELSLSDSELLKQLTELNGNLTALVSVLNELQADIRYLTSHGLT